MRAIADKLLREAYFARHKSVRIPRTDHFSSTSQAARDLLGRGHLVEARRRMDLQGDIFLIYRLTDRGRDAAKKLATVK
jgi:hypothetical protein